MPSYVVKINREDDFYVYWSDIVDAPHIWGPKEGVAAYMIRIGQGQDIEARFDRADENGSSTLFENYYHWDDSGFIYDQLGFLPRNLLGDFLKSYNHETGEFDLSLLNPFEDDEEEDA